MTQHNNTPQEKVNPQDSNYSHLNRPGASVEGDSHYLSLNYGSSPQFKHGINTPQRSGPGGGEYDVLNGKVLIHKFHTHLSPSPAVPPLHLLGPYIHVNSTADVVVLQ